ncbi:MAG: VCBS repeat-containing protein [Bacteroidota bacterium]
MNLARFIRPLIFGFYIFSCLQCSDESRQFTELSADDTGLYFRNDIVESKHNNIMTYEYSYNGGGVAAGDLNHDGLADLYFTGNSTPNKLFLNKGNWKFEDVTAQTKTEGRTDWKTGVTMADVNADGWLDIYLCYSGNAPGEGYNLPVTKDYPNRSNQLYINMGCSPGGTPTFTERAKEYGLDAIGTFSTQAYFFDYDRDQDLDMFLLNHANMFYAAFFNTTRLRNLRHPYFGNKLYRNNNNKFEEVSKEAGIHGSGLNFGLSAAISDLNFDGWPDIYVTNDYEEQDFCYINNRDGTFKEASHQMFGHLSKFGMGSDIADINNDGLQDIMVLDMLPEDNHRQKLLKGPDEYDRYTLAADSGYHHQNMRNTLQLNRGFGPDSLPRFSEIGQLAGVSNTDWSWAPLFVDLDNDGLKDIFVANGYLRDFNNMDFIKYNSEAYAQAKATGKPVDYLKLIQQLPSTRLNNYVFKNEGGIQFSNKTTEWGLTRKSVSNGAVYADLDNDGDLDIVTNNLNDNIMVLRNNQQQRQQNNFVKITLKGKNPNTQGLGSKIWVTLDDKTIFHEAYFTRGFQCSVEPVITIGIGKSQTAKEIKILWPDNTESVVNHVPANQSIVVEQEKTKSAPDARQPPNLTSLHDASGISGIDFRHQENKFIDFKMQRLLFYQLSKLGGKLAKGDVNKDGNDDIFFGGASGQPGTLYFGNFDGTFYKANSQPWNEDAVAEDTDALFFDADNDGDEDIYIVSGGTEFIPGAPLYQDRIYANNGQGLFQKVTHALPEETTSGSCVSAADFDKDGDLDIFVGGRLTPSNYGVIPQSFLLRNDSQPGAPKFTDTKHNILQHVGMVTDAIWTDFNNDTWPDLMLTGEWMPIRLFENKKGKLTELKIPALEKSNGWWTCIFPYDVDRDGDIDYLAGNAGMNLQFKASSTEPVELFSGDFNNDGVLDPIVSYYVQGERYPLASRDELLEQIAPLRKKFVSYSSYALASLESVADREQLEKAYHFQAFELRSSWLENIGGKDFKLKNLPVPSQFSCVNGFISADFDGDGLEEILAVGNFFPYKPQLGRSDASFGTFLYFEGGELQVGDGVTAHTWLNGDIRDIIIAKSTAGAKKIVVSRNNDKAGVYDIRASQSMIAAQHK